MESFFNYLINKSLILNVLVKEGRGESGPPKNFFP